MKAEKYDFEIFRSLPGGESDVKKSPGTKIYFNESSHIPLYPYRFLPQLSPKPIDTSRRTAVLAIPTHP